MAYIDFDIETATIRSSYINHSVYFMPDGMRVFRCNVSPDWDVVVTATKPRGSDWHECEISIFDKRIKVAYQNFMVVEFSSWGDNRFLISLNTINGSERIGVLVLCDDGRAMYEGEYIDTSWSTKLALKAGMFGRLP